MKPEKINPYLKNGNFRVVIETPKGSSNKYVWDKDLGAMSFKKPLPIGFTFPFDFGFIPGTEGEDGDPLDALVLCDYPLMSNCVIECQLLGVLESKQKEPETSNEYIRNDRFVFKAAESIQYKTVTSIKELEEKLINQIEKFFEFYNEQEGKEYKSIGVLGPNKARKLIEAGLVAKVE